MLEHLREPRRLAARFCNCLLAIGLRFLKDAGRTAARFRHDAVGIGLRFVAQAVKVLLGCRHVTEGRDNLLWRIDRLQLDLDDLHTKAIFIEDLLHQFLNGRFDDLALSRKDALDLGATNDLAHGAFGHSLDGEFGTADVEGIVFRLQRIDLPDHHALHVGDILVAGEHQAFFGHIDRGLAPGPRIDTGDEANGDRVSVRDPQLGDRADRIGPVVVQAGACLAHVAAEDHVQADLVGLNGVEPAHRPQADGCQHGNERALAAKAARQSPLQPVLAAAQQFLEVWRHLAPGPTALLSPWTLIIGFPPGAPSTLVGPGHQIPFNRVLWHLSMGRTVFNASCPVLPFISHECEGDFIPLARRMGLAADLPPGIRVDCGKYCIAFRLEGNFGNLEPVAALHEGPVDLCSPCHDYAVSAHGTCADLPQLQRCFQIIGHVDPSRKACTPPGHHDGLTARQGLADGLEGLATHDHRLAHGQVAKVAHVAAQLPQQAIVAADYPIARHRNHENERNRWRLVHVTSPCQESAAGRRPAFRSEALSGTCC